MFKSETEIEVRYAETDQMGIVHHASYVIWFEVGRTALIKEIGFNYAEMEKSGILSPVTDVNVSYKKPTVYGEKILVRTWVKQYNGIRVVYQYEVVNESDQICVTGTSTHVCVRSDNFRPISMRKHLPDWHEIYEKIKEGS